MLRFNSGSWTSTIFVYFGGALPRMVRPLFVYLLYLIALYSVSLRTNSAVSSDGIKFIAASTTFMLVFRLNQCYVRLLHANDMMMRSLNSLNEIVTVALASIMSLHPTGRPSEPEIRAAEMAKVHICRLSIAFAVSLKYNARVMEMRNEGGERVNWKSLRHALTDLVRVKALLTDAEAAIIEASAGLFEESDSSGGDSSVHLSEEHGFHKFFVDFNRFSESARRRHCRSIVADEQALDDGTMSTTIPPLVAQLLRMALITPLSKPWGYPERVMNLYETHINQLVLAFQGMNQIIGVPLPLPYVQLCKVLLLVFLIMYPAHIAIDHGIYGNIIVPFVLGFSLIGFETVASVMENPLGDDESDISMYELIHEFEVQIQSLFNQTSPERSKIADSWREMAEDFGCEEGSDLLLKSMPSHATRRFDRYFQWVPLPGHTVDYIASQSTNIESFHARMFKGALCCCRRRKGDSETRRADVSEDEAVEEPDPFLADHYAINHCLALRSKARHYEVARRQYKALARFSERQPHSVRNTISNHSFGS